MGDPHTTDTEDISHLETLSPCSNHTNYQKNTSKTIDKKNPKRKLNVHRSRSCTDKSNSNRRNCSNNSLGDKHAVIGHANYESN